MTSNGVLAMMSTWDAISGGMRCLEFSFSAFQRNVRSAQMLPRSPSRKRMKTFWSSFWAARRSAPIVSRPASMVRAVSSLMTELIDCGTLPTSGTSIFFSPLARERAGEKGL